MLNLSITCKIVNIYCRCGSPGQSLSPAERSRILILIICMYVCMYVCIYVCIEREREREREQVRTVFVPVHRIQELIQVAENSEINETTAILSNQMQLSRERIAQCEVFLVPFNS